MASKPSRTTVTPLENLFLFLILKLLKSKYHLSITINWMYKSLKKRKTSIKYYYKLLNNRKLSHREIAQK